MIFLVLVGKSLIFWTIIVSKGDKFAHGDSIKEAKESLIYKIGTRDKSKFANLKLNDKLTLEEMIECYRVVTGACEFGVKNFIQTALNNKPKKQYSIKEILNLTKNQYGHQTFHDFFKGN